ncbi:MAG: hypothetical protein LBK58_16340 [Prevotellaceae bacterium]|jgi:hypothetical protein|nr:hypothetical protein [Prevotellaceae bacterium]
MALDKQKIPEWREEPFDGEEISDMTELSDKAKKLYPGPQIEEPDWSAKVDVDFEPP